MRHAPLIKAAHLSSNEALTYHAQIQLNRQDAIRNLLAAGPAATHHLSSVAQLCDLGRELRLPDDMPCEEAVLLAVRVLNNKTRYNQLELTSGRLATVNPGDVIAGALGRRHYSCLQPIAVRAAAYCRLRYRDNRRSPAGNAPEI